MPRCPPVGRAVGMKRGWRGVANGPRYGAADGGFTNFTAVPYASISMVPGLMEPLEKRMATTASAPRRSASAIMRSSATVRAWSVISVYDLISPPTSSFMPAIMSRPMWREVTMLPRTSPRTWTFWPGTTSAEVTIIGKLLCVWGGCDGALIRGVALLAVLYRSSVVALRPCVLVGRPGCAFDFRGICRLCAHLAR